MRTIRKEYERAFLVEPTKLTRLVGIIAERLEDHGFSKRRDSFEVFLSGNRNEEITSLDEVVALENSPKRRIERILIRCSASTSSSSPPEKDVEVDFDSKAVSSQNVHNRTPKISITIRSDDASWASRTLSELEEQVERTKPQGLGWGGALLLLVIPLVAILVVLLTSVRLRSLEVKPQDTMWLTERDLDRIEEMLKQGQSLSDDEVKEIMTRQVRNVLEDNRPQRSQGRVITKQRMFVIGPLVIIAGAVFYLLIMCYPSAVFLWGDEVDHYNNIRNRRRVVWTVIVGATVMSVLANLFSTGLNSWLSP